LIVRQLDSARVISLTRAFRYVPAITLGTTSGPHSEKSFGHKRASVGKGGASPALASPAPPSVEEVQAQLASDEALVLFLDTPEWEETFVWVVTKTDVRWVRSELGTPALTREVAALRCGLDYQSWTDPHCSDLFKVAYTHADHDTFGKPLPFDVARAHALYEGLFGQIEDLLKDKHLLIVPSGPLTQSPFQVLVTEAPKIATPSSFADYRDVAWFARKHAITVLPAVSLPVRT
jgi:hypothetical protein